MEEIQKIIEDIEKTTTCDCDTRNFLLQPTGHTHMCKVHVKARDRIAAILFKSQTSKEKGA
jgi:hypothetical protein